MLFCLLVSLFVCFCLFVCLFLCCLLVSVCTCFRFKGKEVPKGQRLGLILSERLARKQLCQEPQRHNCRPHEGIAPTHSPGPCVRSTVAVEHHDTMSFLVDLVEKWRALVCPVVQSPTRAIYFPKKDTWHIHLIFIGHLCLGNPNVLSCEKAMASKST